MKSFLLLQTRFILSIYLLLLVGCASHTGIDHTGGLARLKRLHECIFDLETSGFPKFSKINEATDYQIDWNLRIREPEWTERSPNSYIDRCQKFHEDLKKSCLRLGCQKSDIIKWLGKETGYTWCLLKTESASDLDFPGARLSGLCLFELEKSKRIIAGRWNP